MYIPSFITFPALFLISFRCCLLYFHGINIVVTNGHLVFVFLTKVVQSGSKVAAEMTIRAKSFSTANEPGGVKYFSTKLDTDFNEIAWTVGNGELLPGLEEAMKGMRRNAIRRIEVPSTQVFSARNNNQLPLPTTKDGKRIFDRLWKTDATLLFEVLVTRIK